MDVHKIKPMALPDDILDRNRLYGMLDLQENGGITLISGPAGYGKSTLAARWLDFRGQKAGWYSLDERDNDMRVFWSYLFHINGCDASVMTGSSGISSPMEFAAALLHIMESRSEQSIMVIDDYQIIGNREIHESLRYLLINLPPPHRAIVISRAEPALSLSRLRMEGRLQEIRAADLVFTKEETESLLEQILPPGSDVSPWEGLHKSTEGWITAIKLAVLASSGRSVSGIMEKISGTNRYLADFLVEEVLTDLDKKDYSLLLDLSVPDSFTLPMLERITEIKDAAQKAESFWKNNFFLSRDREDPTEFRFHPFFRQFLLHRLTLENSPRKKKINQAVSRYYLEQGEKEDALEYAFRGEDRDSVEQLLEPVAAQLSDSSQLFRFDKWLMEDRAYSGGCCPSVELYRARVHLQKGEIDQVLIHLQALEHSLPELNSESQDRLKISINMIRATLALYSSDFESVILLCDETMELIGDEINRLKSMALSFRAIALFYSGLSDTGETAETFERAYHEGIGAGDWIQALNALFQKAVFLRMGGLFSEAGETLDRVEDQAESLSLPPGGIRGTAMSERALLLCEAGSYDEAQTLADGGLDNTNESCSSSSIWWSRYARTLILYNTGEIDEAALSSSALLKTEGAASIPLWFATLSQALDLKIRLARRERKQVERWFADNPLPTGASFDRLKIPLYLVFARLCLETGSDGSAEEILEEVFTDSDQRGLRDIQIESGLLLAYELSKKEDERYMAVLEKTLLAGMERGYFNIYARERTIMPALLESRSIVSTSLISFAMKLGEAVSTARSAPKGGRRIFDLTEREKEILVLLEKGYSNREISDLLFISLNTTKTHLKNINGKLGAENRTQAVFIGRESGLC